MPYSTCCNAHTTFPEMGICNDCFEHCDWEEEEEEEEELINSKIIKNES